MNIRDRIETKKAIVAVIGLGYVGRPLAAEITKAGFKVIGVDVLEARRRYAQEFSGGKIEVTSDYQRLADTDIVVIAVPTPLTKTHDPDLSFVISATRKIAANQSKPQLVCLESTTYPGTTEEVLLPILSSDNRQAGNDFFLVFSPERIDPNNELYPVGKIPKLVSGVTPECLKLGEVFYSKFINEVVPVTSTRVAEMAKILENVFRSVNVALVNELALLCDRMDIDVWEVVKAAATKPFGFTSFSPGPGLGGHCIPVDPFYLSWKAREYHFYTEFIELAGKINESMPYYVVDKIARALNGQGKSINGSKIMLLGIAYKKDVADMRETPALKIIELLEQRGGSIEYHDSHIKDFTENGKTYESVPLEPNTLAAIDVVVIVTDHSDVDYGLVVKHAGLIVDTRNVLAGFTDEHIRRI